MTETSTPGRHWRNDFLASLVVFMVALPLCIAIARACNAPPEAGIITGVIGGLVVGLLAGSPLQVSGPAAGLIVLVLDFVSERDQLKEAGVTSLGGLESLGVVLILAGLFQILAGWWKLGRWFRAVSPAVILGMLGGIGVVIVAKQVHVMVDDKPGESVLENLQLIPWAIYKGFVPDPALPPTHRLAALVGVWTIAVLVLWKPLAPRRLKVLPAALVAVVLATALAHFGGLPIERLAVRDNLLDAIRLPAPEHLKLLADGAIWQMGVVVALIASAETLLCATAVDQLHRGPRTQYNRELAAQGVGNLLCGMVGAMPMTGVIVRSSANVEAGAKTRMSAVLHGVWLLLFVALLPGVLRLIPSSCLAAILVYTGVKLIDIKALRTLYRQSPTEALIALATLIGVVATDLLTGVLIGLGLTVAKLAYTFSHLSIRRHEDPARQRTTLHLEGAATFLRLPELAAALEAVPAGAELHVHFEDLTYIDHACLTLVMNWQRQHESAGGRLVIDWDKLHGRFYRPTRFSASPGPSSARPVMVQTLGPRTGH